MNDLIKKYLSLTYSFMLQVKNGHGKNANPDHRIDVEGYLSEAQIAIAFRYDNIAKKVRTIRRDLMNKDFEIDLIDLEKIQALYYYFHDNPQQKYITIINNIPQADNISDIYKITRPDCGCSK